MINLLQQHFSLQDLSMFSVGDLSSLEHALNTAFWPVCLLWQTWARSQYCLWPVCLLWQTCARFLKARDLSTLFLYEIWASSLWEIRVYSVKSVYAFRRRKKMSTLSVQNLSTLSKGNLSMLSARNLSTISLRSFGTSRKFEHGFSAKFQHALRLCDGDLSTLSLQVLRSQWWRSRGHPALLFD